MASIAAVCSVLPCWHRWYGVLAGSNSSGVATHALVWTRVVVNTRGTATWHHAIKRRRAWAKGRA